MATRYRNPGGDTAATARRYRNTGSHEKAPLPFRRAAGREQYASEDDA